MNTQIKRKLHGSVLLTVVFVMSILIVFLFGTLALALAANNRAHVNYSSAQTSITARSVAESAIKAIENNTPQGKAYAKAIGKLSAGQTAEVAVELSGDKASAYGSVDNVVISYAGTKKYYDVIKQEWLERDLLKFTATVNLSGVTSTSSIYVLKHYEEDDEGESTSGAGFVTTAGANLACQTSLFGGSYISLPKLDDAKKYVYTDKGIELEGKKLTEKFGDASNNDHAFHYQNSNSVIEADLYVNNNMSVNNLSGIIFPKEGTGITVLGDMYFSSSAIQNENHLVYLYKGKKDNLQFKEVPYIYVDGKIYGASGVKLGNNDASSEDKKFPLNTFCGSIDATMKSAYTINSNIYCMNTPGENGKSYFRGQDKSNKLYIWANSVATKSNLKGTGKEIGGEICSKGDVELQNCEINGDVRVEGNLSITKQNPDANDEKVIVHGDVVVGGTIEGEENLILDAGKAIYNSTKGSKKIEAENLIGNYDIYTPHEITIKDENDVPYIKWVDKDDQPLNDGDVFNNGDFNPSNSREITNPVDLKLYYTIEVDCDPIWGYDKDALCLINETQFYAETKVENFKNEGDYDRKADYSKKVSEPKFEYNYTVGPDAYLNKIGESSIYPKYAERNVILGLENKENQIVRTMEDVISKVANPYSSADLPPGIKTMYTDLINKGTADAVYCKNLENLNKLNDNLVVESGSIKYEDEKDAEGNVIKDSNDNEKQYITYTTTEDATDYNNKCAYISKSCILDGFSYGNDSQKKLIINPGDKNLLIVIKGNTSIASGTDIMIDDSGSGKVYFYVDKNAKFTLSGTNVITTSYMSAIKTNNKFTYQSTPLAGYTKLEDVPNYIPKVYLYGGEDSEFNVAKTAILTMNITSPNLTGTIKATDDAGIASFVYNDIDVRDLSTALGVTVTGSKQFLFGCFNAENIIMENTFNVVYVGKSDDEGGAEAKDDEFWYKPLYYHDF